MGERKRQWNDAWKLKFNPHQQQHVSFAWRVQLFPFTLPVQFGFDYLTSAFFCTVSNCLDKWPCHFTVCVCLLASVYLPLDSLDLRKLVFSFFFGCLSLLSGTHLRANYKIILLTNLSSSAIDKRKLSATIRATGVLVVSLCHWLLFYILCK